LNVKIRIYYGVNIECKDTYLLWSKYWM